MMFAPGHLSTAFTLQFGTFSPGVINKQVCASIHIHLFLCWLLFCYSLKLHPDLLIAYYYMHIPSPSWSQWEQTFKGPFIFHDLVYWMKLFVLLFCTYLYMWRIQACYGLYEKPNVVSLSTHEQQKQEATDNLVIGGGADLIDKYKSVRVPESHGTSMLNSIPPTSRVSTSTNLFLVALQLVLLTFILYGS
jgi:hypothetical protein